MKTYIGIDLGGTNVRCSVVKPDGTVVETVKGPSHAKDGAEAVVSNIVDLVKQLHDWQDASGIGIAVPGPVARDGNGMAMATNIPCHGKISAARHPAG
jgi:glucokinase